MSEMKFFREKGDGDPTDDGSLEGYVYLTISADVGDEQVGSFSGCVQQAVAEKVKAALDVTGEPRPERIVF